MSTTTTPARFVRELRDMCGAEHVIEDPAQLHEGRIAGVAPAVAVEPASADEVAAVLRFANEHGLNVVPAGGFTHQQTGNKPAQVDVLLSTRRLTEVEHYDPGDLTVGVGAGCTVAQLTSMVAKDGLLFAADVAQPQRATLGGALATGMTGPLRHGYGGLRDYCIGIRFVTADGRKGKGGGRVVKNVAGYDMMKLLIGSWGTLAIVTSASFKLFPAPRQTRTFIARFPSSGEALHFRDAVLRSPLSPICLELISPEAGSLLPAIVRQESSSRTEPSEAAPGRDTEACWCVLLRASGSDAVLVRFRSELGSAVPREITDEDERRLWCAIQDFPHTLPEQRPDCVLMSLWLPLTEARTALDGLLSLAKSTGLTLVAIGRVGVGHLLAGLCPTEDSPADLAALSAFRDRLPRDASMRVLYCPEELRAACFRTPTDLASMRAIKHALDPKDILNRGRFVF